MNDATNLQIQEIRIRELLDKASNDPIVAPQLQTRLAEIRDELKTLVTEPGKLLPRVSPTLPRVAIFLRGGTGVQGSVGIRPSLAGEALIQYERMFREQALHDEREHAKASGRHRRPRGTPTPSLLFTGTPRGSFGFEFVPQFSGDESLLSVHNQALHNVANAVVLVSSTDLNNAVKQIPSRVLQPLKQFLRTLANYDAELRMAFHDSKSAILNAQDLRATADRLEHGIKLEVLDLQGTFRGITLESGYFDIVADDGGLISGTVDDELTEEDFAELANLINHRCSAKIEKTEVRSISGSINTGYVLLSATRID